jgi:hypothetical protein
LKFIFFKIFFYKQNFCSSMIMGKIKKNKKNTTKKKKKKKKRNNNASIRPSFQ